MTTSAIPTIEQDADQSTPAQSSATPTRSRNVLTTPQVVQLWNWCERNKISLPSVSNTILAQTAAAELQFPITPANIAGMISEMGIEKRKPAGPPTLEEHLAALRQDHDTLRRDFDAFMCATNARFSKLLDTTIAETDPLPPFEPPATHPQLNLPTEKPTEPQTLQP